MGIGIPQDSLPFFNRGNKVGRGWLLGWLDIFSRLATFFHIFGYLIFTCLDIFRIFRCSEFGKSWMLGCPTCSTGLLGVVVPVNEFLETFLSCINRIAAISSRGR